MEHKPNFYVLCGAGGFIIGIILTAIVAGRSIDNKNDGVLAKCFQAGGDAVKYNQLSGATYCHYSEHVDPVSL